LLKLLLIKFFETAAPILKNCEHIQPLKDELGNYLRSICVMNTDSSYDDASINCRANGMELFKIDSSKTKTAFASFVDLQLHHFSENIWIDDSGTFDVYTSNCSASMYSICQFTGDTSEGKGKMPDKLTNMHTDSQANRRTHKQVRKQTSTLVCQFIIMNSKVFNYRYKTSKILVWVFQK
jgi:hypothetical protein